MLLKAYPFLWDLFTQVPLSLSDFSPNRAEPPSCLWAIPSQIPTQRFCAGSPSDWKLCPKCLHFHYLQVNPQKIPNQQELGCNQPFTSTHCSLLTASLVSCSCSTSLILSWTPKRKCYSCLPFIDKETEEEMVGPLIPKVEGPGFEAT